MPPLPSAHGSMADSGSGAADHLNQDSRCYLLEYVKKQTIKKHEKPVLDEYHKDVSVLREGGEESTSFLAGVTDQNRLEEAARAKAQAGLKAVQPALAAEFKALEDLIISECEPLVRTYLTERLATLKRDNASSARQPALFTREVIAGAGEAWEANRIASGLPIEGDLDDLDPGEIVRGPTEGDIHNLDPTAEGDPSTNTPVEEHFDNGSDGDAMDFESGSEEVMEEAEEEEEEEDEEDADRDKEHDPSESSFTVDGHETSSLESRV